jgi:hypothetical protein
MGYMGKPVESMGITMHYMGIPMDSMHTSTEWEDFIDEIPWQRNLKLLSVPTCVEDKH